MAFGRNSEDGGDAAACEDGWVVCRLLAGEVEAGEDLDGPVSIGGGGEGEGCVLACIDGEGRRREEAVVGGRRAGGGQWGGKRGVAAEPGREDEARWRAAATQRQ